MLGEGGMVTVYLADDLKHERKLALKVLKPELAAVDGAERFLAEIKTTANMQYPHILPIHDSGEADGFLLICHAICGGGRIVDAVCTSPMPPSGSPVSLS
jgi:serine/threonine protein kinase